MLKRRPSRPCARRTSRSPRPPPTCRPRGSAGAASRGASRRPARCDARRPPSPSGTAPTATARRPRRSTASRPRPPGTRSAARTARTRRTATAPCSRPPASRGAQAATGGTHSTSCRAAPRSVPDRVRVRPCVQARDDLAEQLEREVRVLLLHVRRDLRRDLGALREVRRRRCFVDVVEPPRPVGRPSGPTRGRHPPDRQRLDRPERAGCLAELGEERDRRVVEVELPLVAELQDRGRGERLRDRGDPEQRPRIVRSARLDVGVPVARRTTRARRPPRRPPPRRAGAPSSRTPRRAR